MAKRSPVDEFPAPEQLTARVVRPGPSPCVHGYDVHDDLVRHYDFAELVYTALTGRPPARHEGRGLNVLLGFLLPIGVAEAPSHGAVIARLCGAPSSRVIAAASVALCEQARFELARHAPLLEWLDGGRKGRPPAAALRDREGDPAVHRLHEHLSEAGLPVVPSDVPLSLESAIIAGLHACGLTRGGQLEAAWCLSRLPAATAEAMAVAPGAFREYPIRQPPFELEGRQLDDE